MSTTKVFKSGNSQAVRIPREFQLDVDEVEIIQEGDRLILKKPEKNLGNAFHLLSGFPEDFFEEGRKDSPPQKRASW
ncbi:MAG: AbrB/MazE/SpoVT family DNA-binding domain-containing protein [Deltaproteobacteria bacterium]|nr:MAG: AbrB/MazE/SpoVT family DNA-binding domain-containing protein [Deltaproteobacteria bacterium]